MQNGVDINEVVGALLAIEQDKSVPKNVRLKVKDAMNSLTESNGKSTEVKVDQVIQRLDELSDDPNLPPYTRTQIWNVVSTLESKQ